MPRAAVKLSPAPESVPEWWGAEFHKRQAAIQGRVVRVLRKANRAMQVSEIHTHVSGILKREIDHAIATLLSRGTVRQFEKRSTAYRDSTNTRLVAHIKLTEQAR
jgi:hypothetical protein